MASSSQYDSNPVADDNTNEASNVEVLPKTGRIADIWEHYDLVKIDGKVKARCRDCQRTLTSQGNSTLRRHRASCLAHMAPGESSQMQLDRHGQIWVYDHMLARELAMKCVIKLGLPFNHFDNETMTEFIQDGLQPKYKQVSRTTLKRDAFKAYLKSRKELKSFFKDFTGRVSLTSDVWSAANNLGLSFICITAHWIDPITWEMCKRTIEFQNFEYPHTGNAIYYILSTVIHDFNLKDKLLSISFDNASANTTSIELLKQNLNPICEGKFFHTRCSCHIINLIVQIGLEHCENTILKFKEMLKFVYTNKSRQQAFKRFCHERHVKFLKPEWDVPTRWNSTYKMLARLIRNREIIMEFYTKETMHTITNDDWSNIETFVDILEVFNNATQKLSGVYYPTTPILLSQIYVISIKLTQYRDHPTFGYVVEFMIKKLLKYYNELPPIFTCAAALNPTINVLGVETFIEGIAESLGFDINDNNYLSNNTEYFSNCFKELFQFYNQKYGSTSRGKQQMGSSSSTVFNKNTSDTDLIFNTLSRKKSRNQNTGLDELAIYTSTHFSDFMTKEEFVNFNILEWWREKSPQYPVMSAIARDLLTVQASTVASESCFSVSGRILSERRSRLTPESLLICICLKDHYDAQDRAQDHRLLEDVGDMEEIEDEILADEASQNTSPTMPQEDDVDDDDHEQ